MKKFMKVSAIMAGILIVSGLALAVPAIAIKGTAAVSNIVDEVTKGRVHVNFGNGAGSDWGVYLGNAGKSIVFKDGVDIISGVYEGTYAADGITGLQIELGGCSMEIKASEDGDFHVNTSGIGKFQVYADGDTLCIKGGKNDRLIGGESLGTILLYVPQDYGFDEVDIALGAGEIAAGTALEAKKITLNVGAGQIECNGILKADSVEAALGAGEILFKNMAVKELAVSVGMGSMELAGSIEEKAELECSMGSILMTLAGSERDYNYKLNASMGEVCVGDYSQAGLGSENTIFNNASCDIELDCSMGSIEVSFMN